MAKAQSYADVGMVADLTEARALRNRQEAMHVEIATEISRSVARFREATGYEVQSIDLITFLADELKCPIAWDVSTTIVKPEEDVE